MFTSDGPMGGKYDHSNFERSMAVGTKQSHLSISASSDFLFISCTNLMCEEPKHVLSVGSVAINCLLMRQSWLYSCSI